MAIISWTLPEPYLSTSSAAAGHPEARPATFAGDGSRGLFPNKNLGWFGVYEYIYIYIILLYISIIVITKYIIYIFYNIYIYHYISTGIYTSTNARGA